MPRNRPCNSLRPISIVAGFLDRNPASVLYSSGATRVLCTDGEYDESEPCCKKRSLRRPAARACSRPKPGGTTEIGPYVAAFIAVKEALAWGRISRPPLVQALGAVSVGVVHGGVCRDMDYEEDSQASVALNVVLAESGAILELQGTSEGGNAPLTRHLLGEMLDVATAGIRGILEEQRKALEEWSARRVFGAT